MVEDIQNRIFLAKPQEKFWGKLTKISLIFFEKLIEDYLIYQEPSSVELA